jgi:hypothetical protein
MSPFHVSVQFLLVLELSAAGPLRAANHGLWDVVVECIDQLAQTLYLLEFAGLSHIL